MLGDVPVSTRKFCFPRTPPIWPAANTKKPFRSVIEMPARGIEPACAPGVSFMFRPSAIAVSSNNPANAVPSAFFTITLAARSLFGSPEPTRPAGHLKRLRMDSG